MNTSYVLQTLPDKEVPPLPPPPHQCANITEHLAVYILVHQHISCNACKLMNLQFKAYVIVVHIH